jgi:predicted AlkP superfamily phosphohydrolase/phosphomutase
MHQPRILFFAFDSADCDLLNLWMDDGSLPNLAALRDSSLAGPLATPRGLGSDAVWPSVFTGVDASLHGRYHHKQDAAGSYRPPEQRDVLVQRTPVWQRFSEAGQRVAVLDLPKAPLCEGLNGVQVVDWHSHYSYPEEFRTWPPEQAQALADSIAGHVTCPCLGDRYKDYDPRADQSQIDSLLHTIDESLAMVMQQLEREPWDLVMTAFSASHCCGHRFWHLHDASHPRHAQSLYRGADPLRAVYAAIDNALGRLLQRLGDEVKVVVFAGAGMGPNYVRRELLDEILVRLDRGRPSITRRAMVALKQLWHRLPAGWRSALAVFAHRAESRLVSHDRSDRRFFAVQANDSVGGVRINLHGREPHGQVPPEAFGATIDRVVKALEELRVVDTGAPLVSDVVPAEMIYHGELLDRLPDILIEWNHAAPVTAVNSPAIGTLRQDRLPDWSGTHRSGALLMVRAPGLRPGVLPAGASVYDIAPTLAALGGLPADAMDGQSLVAG